MRTRKKKLALIVSALVFTFSASSQGAKASGEISISDDGGEVQAKLQITTGENEDSAGGYFQYLDDGDKVYIEVTGVKIDGEYAWFAGKCIEGGAGYSGRWLFVAVHDGGKPGRLVDQIWWEWIPAGDNAESIAKSKVRNMRVPSERKDIQSGDIKVAQ